MKLRLASEASRLPVRIFKQHNGARYTLICEWGFLKGTYPHSDLNTVYKWAASTFGADIMSGLAYYDLDGTLLYETCHLETITLNQAVRQINCGSPSVSESQKLGRKFTQAAKSIFPLVNRAHAQSISSERDIEPCLRSTAAVTAGPSIPSIPSVPTSQVQRWDSFPSGGPFEDFRTETLKGRTRRYNRSIVIA